MAHNRLTDLKVSRVALVDRPANPGARVMLFKRGEGEPNMAGIYLAKRKGDAALPADVEAYLKREFTQDQRDRATSSGAALPDGSFPIENRSDLKNAVQAFGRAKDKAKAKAHITSRARALDATSILPAEWKVGKMQLLAKMTNDDALAGFADVVEVFIGEMRACDFDTIQAEAEAREYANCLLEEVDEAVCSLRQCFAEIDMDDTVTDKPGALQESLTQFKAHIQGIIPEGVENALVAAALLEAGFEITEGGALTKRENDMGYSIELKKSLGLPVTANDADVNKALEAQAIAAKRADAILKMSGKHSAFMANDKAKMPAGGKEAFADMSADERDQHMDKNPIEKSDVEKAADKKAEDEAKAAKEAEEAKKRAGDEVLKVAGVEIRKSVVGDATFAVMKSQQEAIEKGADAAAIATIEKRANIDLVNIGKADELATMLHGIAKFDGKLATQVEGVLKTANERITKGGLLDEVGKSNGGKVAKASSEIEALAQAKIGKGEAKNIFKARDMVRKERPDLAKAETEERKAA